MQAIDWNLVTDVELFDDLDAVAAAFGVPEGCVGAVFARPHPTGWFLSAHHRRDLTPDELADFAEFARVRAYLLLTEGPSTSTWAPAGDSDWVAWSLDEHLELAEAVPDAVPAHWR